MRIIKYVFLLLFLALFAITVYIATQKGEYFVQRSRVIKSPPSVVYNYISDLRTWEQWDGRSESDASTSYKYSPNTVGAGSFYSWRSATSDGNINTTFAKENDSLVHEVASDGNSQIYFWKLKDTVGGTKVTWSVKGKMGFMDKIDATLQGGAAYIIGNSFERQLAGIDHNLGYELQTYKITLNGVVQKPGVKFLKQTVNSKIGNHSRNMRIMISKMNSFFEENNIARAGKPFIIYHTYDTGSGITKFSVCMPVTEEIFTAPGSDLQFEAMPPYSAVKISQNGDYSHFPKSMQRASDYIIKGGLQRPAGIVALKELKIGSDESKQPSKWVSEVYFPVNIQPVADTLVPTLPTPRRTVPVTTVRDTTN